MNPRLAAITTAAVLALAATAGAYIERIYSFKEVLDESHGIAVGRVESVDPGKKTAVVVLDRALKGNLDFKRVQMNLGTAAPDHNAYVLARLKAGAEIIGFYQQDGANIVSEWHAGDTWFQHYATDDPANRDKVWWRMSHIEIRLNRTFSGSTAALIQLTEDVLAKRASPPAPNPDVPPIDPSRPPPKRVNTTGGGRGGGFHHQMVYKRASGAPVRGIAWADANHDERLDFYVCRPAGNSLLVNSDTGFEDMTAALGVKDRSGGAAWADYNADGYPDLLSGLRLFSNIGGGFRDDSRLVPAPAEGRPDAAGWIDFDGDGLPDLLVAGATGIRLYQNMGKGPDWFVDVSEKAGLGPKAAPGAAGYLLCFDYDGDGYADFFCTAGAGMLFHNERNGTFRLAKDSGLELPQAGYACGAAAGDYDNDGHIDVFVPGPGRARLYHNNGDGTFTDAAAAAGDLARADEPSVSAAWGDVNCDGFLDLLVCYPGGSPRLFVGDGRGKFTDLTDSAGLKGVSGVHAASFADINNDGRLDLAMNAENGIIVATSEMARPTDRLPVLVEIDVHKGATGAAVRAEDPRGRLLGLRELGGAEGCGGQPSPVAHFALPAGQCIISVCLSDGRAARRTVDVKPGVLRIEFREEEFN